MQGISRLTSYEIASNPDDIVISYGPDRKTGKFIGRISRGEGGNFKPLFSTKPIYNTLEQAKWAMQDLVEQIKESANKELEDS